MSNEEIKTLIEQEEKSIMEGTREFAINNDCAIADGDWDDFVEPMVLNAMRAIATFYEQTILPEVLKEKEREILRLTQLWNRHYRRSDNLKRQLKAKEKQMEEEIQKAFEAGIKATILNINWETESVVVGSSDYDLYLKSTTQSTESGNLNTK